MTNEMEPKRLGLLREVVPHAHTIGFLLNPSFAQAESQLADMQQAARAMNLAITVLRADTDQEIDAAFEAIAQQRVPALVVEPIPFLTRAAKSWLRWRRATRCPPFITSGNTPTTAA